MQSKPTSSDAAGQESFMAKKKKLSGYEKRNLRLQQIIFIAIGVIIILSMVISLIVNI
jgi:hypothetical protein